MPDPSPPPQRTVHRPEASAPKAYPNASEYSRGQDFDITAGGTGPQQSSSTTFPTHDVPDYSRNVFREEEVAASGYAPQEAPHDDTEGYYASSPAKAPAYGGAPQDPAKKNWPVCYPIARSAISEDIPSPHRFTIRIAFITYHVFLAALCMNLLAELVLIFGGGGGKSSSIGGTMGLLFAPLYLVAGTLFGWISYKYLYNGIKADSSRKVFCFFFLYAMVIIFLIIAVIGPTGWHFTGFLTTLEIGTKWSKKTPLVFSAMGLVLWGATTLMAMGVMVLANRAYRNAGIQGFNDLRGDAGTSARDAAWQAASDRPGLLSS